jgi:uncharacterized protein (TIGR03067 family)
MTGRLIVAVVVLSSVPAFAPAPFPRPSRDGDRNGIDMKRFQGTWKVISMEIVQAGGRLEKLSDWGEQAQGTTAVRVQDDKWTYLSKGNHSSSSYWLDIDPAQKPAAINWYTQADRKNPGMLGLIRREGDQVTILYYATTPNNRPKTFENPPANWWVLKLRKGG